MAWVPAFAGTTGAGSTGLGEEPEAHVTTMTWRPLAEYGALEIDLVTYFREVHAE